MHGRSRALCLNTAEGKPPSSKKARKCFQSRNRRETSVAPTSATLADFCPASGLCSAIAEKEGKKERGKEGKKGFQKHGRRFQGLCCSRHTCTNSRLIKPASTTSCSRSQSEPLCGCRDNRCQIPQQENQTGLKGLGCGSRVGGKRWRERSEKRKRRGCGGADTFIILFIANSDPDLRPPETKVVKSDLTCTTED